MKRIVFDMDMRTESHLKSGRVFRIDRRLQRFPGGICVDRTFLLHESISGMRSYLLPGLNLWAKFFEGHGGPHEIYCYMDMARIIDEQNVITMEDLYLDVVIDHDGRWHLLDVDEFRAAIAAGELTPDQIQTALEGLENACHLVDEHGLGLENYLRKLVTMAYLL